MVSYFLDYFFLHRNDCDICELSVTLYRVSQKKRNGGFSVPCELKVLYLFTSLDQTSSAEENDTKIIKLGWVVLILCPFLEIFLDLCDR